MDDPVVTLPKVKAREGFAVAWDMVGNSAYSAGIASQGNHFGLCLD